MLYRIAASLICAWCLLGSRGALAVEPAVGFAAHVALQDDDRAAAASQFAYELSLLESQGDWQGMADLLHPDSAMLTPAEVVVGWYTDLYAAKSASPIVITGVTEESWFWPVNGQTYDSVAVAYTQDISEGSSVTSVPGVIHLVEGPTGWGWFFGAERGFLNEQIQLYAPDFFASGIGGLVDPAAAWDAERAARFPDPLHAHVDAFWATRFASEGWEYRSPAALTGFSEAMDTPCGIADPEVETAFYCVIDETIYYSAPFQELAISQIGDFGWVVIVAHEWGHHVQHLLGQDFAPDSFRTGSEAPLPIEQQADCLAGAYTDGAELSGWLDPGDVDEALIMTELAGDPSSAESTDPLAHGTAEERVAAFLSGYREGLSACEVGD